MGAPRTKTFVMDVFAENPGMVMALGEIASLASIKAGRELDKRQAANAISQLRTVDNVCIEAVVKGSTYVYKPNGKVGNSKPLYEEIARRGDMVVLMDENGDIYKAVKL